MTKRSLTVTLWLIGAVGCSAAGSDQDVGPELVASPRADGIADPTQAVDDADAQGSSAQAAQAGDSIPSDADGMSADGQDGADTPGNEAGDGDAPSAGAGGSGADDPSSGTGDAGEGAAIPADAPAPADVSAWADAGPFGSRVVESSGPDGQFTLFVPDPLAGDGTPNPIVTWGNGSLTTPSSYRSLLSHYATHGIFVVASNDTNVGSGQEMIAGMRWAIAESDRADSEYFGKLDPDAVGSIGYSQGGIGAVIAGNEPEVKTTVPIAGGDESITNIVHPVFLIGNENDTAAPIDVIEPQFTSEDTTGPFVFGILLDTGHLETLGDGGRHRGYTTAWLAFHLLDDAEAYRVFYGDEGCTLCEDSEWDTQRKNLP